VTQPASLPTATPPGSYPEPPAGRQRWWDGAQWAFYAEVAPTTTYHHPTNGMATASLVLGGIVVFVLTVAFVANLTS
jgi:hypothetical protein